MAVDTRLTHHDGARSDANKMVIARCTGARMAIAYTGTARIGSISTDAWIERTLQESGAPQASYEGVLDALAAGLDKAARRSHDVSGRPLSIVVATRGDNDTFELAAVSNFERIAKDRKSVVTEHVGEFEPFRIALHDPTKPIGLAWGAIDDDIALLKPVKRRISAELRRAGAPLDEDAIVELMASTIQLQARHKKHGSLISPNCVTAAITSTGVRVRAFQKEGGVPLPAPRILDYEAVVIV